ncbi:MAG TPA: ion channel [Caulobacteraceae bacterium]|nr:ion channel [Caulobacteraceae bacterium]
MARKAASRRRAPRKTQPPERVRFTAVRASRKDIVVRGGQRGGLRDLYHRVLTMSWWRFTLLMAAVYLGANAVFAELYLIDPRGVAGARPGAFADAFFFSVQTLSTIGYGAMVPKSLYANCVMTAEAFFALGIVALATGLIFARVSRPTARVMFSRVAVIVPYEGAPTLMFRAANQRGNQILEAEASVNLLRETISPEGQIFRRFQALPLLQAKSPMFTLSWTMMHRIDDASPLSGETAQSLMDRGAEIVVSLSGVDDIFAQRIYARHAYLPEEIVWDRPFEDVLSFDEVGRRVVDYTRFHNVQGQEPAGSD